MTRRPVQGAALIAIVLACRERDASPPADSSMMQAGPAADSMTVSEAALTEPGSKPVRFPNPGWFTMTGPDRPNPFADSLAELESRIAAADAGGEPVPPEARQMLEKLRDLIAALGGLSATLGDLAAQLPDDGPPAPPSGDGFEQAP